MSETVIMKNEINIKNLNVGILEKKKCYINLNKM